MEIRYEVQDIANYFLSKSEKITPKKIQKLLYFAYSWYLAMMNDSVNMIETKLFDASFEAWIHGPVCPQIYSDYKKFGANNIGKYKGKLVDFTEDDLDVLDQIWNIYGKYNANQLESITHQHDPWKKTRKKAKCSTNDWCCEEISDKLIFNYYVEKLEG
ncbi:DUF4065 domain-containing protein [Clostridium estertheticum]|uniref:Panacea domain-containing protein n=1 Tax=Clostridium estertheticum TaxID=238834 RepID=UPI0013E98B98|nr:type II toxin-antitoxin system antitoxin SocA domain-containing protein [Clostridium estertheticum]MBZ9688487.1 DUF4065 domain-containing protein [Clostridium estertheticum]